MIEIKNLNKGFADLKVIDGVDFLIPDKEIFGLVGINGAGKSTLLRLMSGVYKAESGDVLYDEAKVYENPLVKKDILFISDNPYSPRSYNVDTLKEFYGNFYDFDNDKYQHYLELFKVNEKKPLNDFSKGMKRRVYLAVAFAICPKYLLLDETFDGLDPVGKMIFKKELLKLKKEKEMTVVIASHSLRELEDICTSYGIMKDGKVFSATDKVDANEKLFKVLLAFDKEVSNFASLNIIDKTITGKFVTLILKGKKEEIERVVEEMSPLASEILELGVEESLIYKEGELYE